ncbi:YdcF family protein ['Paenibacillus yunnanensis' Narsing Rao et al. 2020]|uniref:YdcF family protein n=1 Tax=Paenibacillus tengchongensis TaxID=2608684 RepID=UPI00124F6C6C|nr:YdcF family protein [Paenibacillus tengchongensis]
MDWYVYQKDSSPIRRMSGKRRRSRRKYLLLTMLAGVLAAGLLWVAVVFNNINSAATDSPLPKADAGIILGMSMWGDEPSPGLQERLNYGLELYRQGAFSNFIVSGGLDREDYKYTEAEGMRNYLVAHGVPEEVIHLDNKSTSTYENLRFSQNIMQEEGFASAIVITHTFHGTRALEMAEQLGYRQPALAVTESQTMSMLKYKSREILAYTKWKLQQPFL